MTQVVSFTRALAEGASRAQIMSIARWHDARADFLRKKLKGEERARVGGEMISLEDVYRHLDTSDALWEVADQVGHAARLAAA